MVMTRTSLLGALLAVVLTLPASAAPTDPGGTFFDDDLNTHEANIEAVAMEGITLGCDSAGTVFCPTQPVTRAQMATFLARALGLPDTATDYFTDDTNNAHEANINKIAEAGITLGCGGTDYCPTDYVNRAQMATFLARGFMLPDTATDYFTDDTGNTHEANINKVAEAGISLGCETGLFCPLDNVNRAQMATFLARARGLTPLDPAPRPQTTNGTQLTLFQLITNCADVLNCPGQVSVPAGTEFYVFEGWNLDNWSASSDLDKQAFNDPTTRAEFVLNGGDPLRTVETFEVDADDTARKRFSFQFPSTMTGTHELVVSWYQLDVLAFRVIVELTIT